MRGYSGPRYGVQYTAGMRSPSMFITKEYKEYLSSLPPIQQISLAEKLASDVNDRYRELYLSRFGEYPKYTPGYTDWRWTIPDIFRRSPGAPYNTRTHTQYYYN